MTVKLSIGSPVVTMNPGTHGAWEATATIEDSPGSPRPPTASGTTT